MWSPKFRIGDTVFAKMRGYPPWPAKVESTQGSVHDSSNKVKYHVYFYGTKQIALCKEEDLCSYRDNYLTLSKPRKNKGFNEAVQEINAELGLDALPETTKTSHHEPNRVSKEPKTTTNKLSHSNENASEKTSLSEMSQNRPIKGKNSLCENISIDNNINGENKEKLMSSLKVEAQMLNVIFAIQSSLSLQHADTETCLKLLDEMYLLEFTPLMLKKHPEALDTIQKLQCYIGNTKNWNMTEEERVIFSTKAILIQDKAKLIFKKMKSMFLVPEGKSFLNFFIEERKKFESCTKHMSVNELFCLLTEPTENDSNCANDNSH